MITSEQPDGEEDSIEIHQQAEQVSWFIYFSFQFLILFLFMQMGVIRCEIYRSVMNCMWSKWISHCVLLVLISDERFYEREWIVWLELWLPENFNRVSALSFNRKIEETSISKSPRIQIISTANPLWLELQIFIKQSDQLCYKVTQTKIDLHPEFHVQWYITSVLSGWR